MSKTSQARKGGRPSSLLEAKFDGMTLCTPIFDFPSLTSWTKAGISFSSFSVSFFKAALTFFSLSEVEYEAIGASCCGVHIWFRLYTFKFYILYLPCYWFSDFIAGSSRWNDLGKTFTLPQHLEFSVKSAVLGRVESGKSRIWESLDT